MQPQDAGRIRVEISGNQLTPRQSARLYLACRDFQGPVGWALANGTGEMRAAFDAVGWQDLAAAASFFQQVAQACPFLEVMVLLRAAQPRQEMRLAVSEGSVECLNLAQGLPIA